MDNKNVQSQQPYDISLRLLEMSHQEQLELIPDLPIRDAAEALEYLEPEVQYRILHHLDDTIASPLLKQISSDIVVDLLLAIHPLQAEQLLELLPTDYREKINQLMTYPEDTAGSLMTVDYISARAHWSGEHTIDHIRKVGHEAEFVSYVYVTDVMGELVGIVSLKQIILAHPKTLLREIAMKDVISAPALMEQEEVANLCSRYNFFALPVIDSQNRLIGIITYDDVAEVIEEETTEDFQKIGGSQPLTEPYFKTAIWELYKKRIVWLLILFIGGAITTSVLRTYEDYTQKVGTLTLFITLLTGTGGNTGSQIITTLIRALGVGEVQFKDVLKVIRRELITGLLLGISLGGIGFILAMLVIKTVPYKFETGLVVAFSALFIVLWSSFVSAVLPLFLHRIKVDPAVVSGPLISTLVDGTGLIIYFHIAKLILPQL